MASYLVAGVLLVLLVRGILYFVQRTRSGQGVALSLDRAGITRYVACFFSGVLFANAVPHFVHGISAMPFPAPFGKLLTPGFPQYASNVIWGFINIVLGYNLFALGKVAGPDKVGRFCFFAGVLTMGLFLAFVFSHGAH